MILSKSGFFCGFLSTPSGWRATWNRTASVPRSLFLSTPSGWRATIITLAYGAEKILISIHALRVEGDNNRRFLQWQKLNFYPRPPGGGRPR